MASTVISASRGVTPALFALPDDIVAEILSQAGERATGSASSVCKHLHRIVQTHGGVAWQSTVFAWPPPQHAYPSPAASSGFWNAARLAAPRSNLAKGAEVVAQHRAAAAYFLTGFKRTSVTPSARALMDEVRSCLDSGISDRVNASVRAVHCMWACVYALSDMFARNDFDCRNRAFRTSPRAVTLMEEIVSQPESKPPSFMSVLRMISSMPEGSSIFLSQAETLGRVDDVTPDIMSNMLHIEDEVAYCISAVTYLYEEALRRTMSSRSMRRGPLKSPAAAPPRTFFASTPPSTPAAAAIAETAPSSGEQPAAAPQPVLASRTVSRYFNIFEAAAATKDFAAGYASKGSRSQAPLRLQAIGSSEAAAAVSTAQSPAAPTPASNGSSALPGISPRTPSMRRIPSTPAAFGSSTQKSPAPASPARASPVAAPRRAAPCPTIRVPSFISNMFSTASRSRVAPAPAAAAVVATFSALDDAAPPPVASTAGHRSSPRTPSRILRRYQAASISEEGGSSAAGDSGLRVAPRPPPGMSPAAIRAAALPNIIVPSTPRVAATFAPIDKPFWPCTQDLSTFKKGKIAFLTVCDDIIVCQSSTGLCAAFLVNNEVTTTSTATGSQRCVLVPQMSSPLHAVMGSMPPHVFLNAHAKQVVHCTYFNRTAAVPALLLCVSDRTAELQCFSVPLSAIRQGYTAVQSSMKRIFDSETFAYPGFIEWNSINQLALTNGVDASGLERYKVWDLRTFTEIASINPRGAVDVKFSHGFVTVAYSNDVVADMAFEADSMLLDLPDAALRTDVREAADDFHSRGIAARTALALKNVAMMRHAANNDSSSSAHVEDVKADLRTAVSAGAMLGIRILSVRAGTAQMVVVVPIVPGCTIQLLEMFHGRLMLKQASYPLRIIHIPSGRQEVVSVEAFPTPFAQIFCYAKGVFLCIHREQLDIRDADAHVLGSVTGPQAHAVFHALVGCSQTGSNVHVMSDESTAIMLGRSPMPVAPLPPHADDAALAEAAIAATAAEPSDIMMLNMSSAAVMDRLPPLSSASRSVRISNDRGWMERGLTGVTAVRVDEVNGYVVTADVRGGVMLWT